MNWGLPSASVSPQRCRRNGVFYASFIVEQAGYSDGLAVPVARDRRAAVVVMAAVV
jgi:hypothetical protein